MIANDEDLYERAWEAFRRLSRPADHRRDWGHWAAGHDLHLLVLAPVAGAASRASITRVQGALRNLAGVEIHPPEFLHITLQSLGFVSRAELQPSDGLRRLALELAPRIAQINPFEVMLGGVNALHSCAFLEVRPSAGLRALRHAVRAAAGAGIQELDPYPDYLFHLTIGYFGQRASMHTLVPAIARLRGHAAGRLLVDRVDLVALPTDQAVPFPPLAPVARFKLGAEI